MIAHQTIGVHLPPSLRACLAEHFQETLSVEIVPKNRLASVPTIQEMVESVCVLDPDLAGHPAVLRRLPLLCQ
jgi:hypothetical protein